MLIRHADCHTPPALLLAREPFSLHNVAVKSIIFALSSHRYKFVGECAGCHETFVLLCSPARLQV